MNTINRELIFVMACLNRYSNILTHHMYENAAVINKLSSMNRHSIDYEMEVRRIARKYREKKQKELDHVLIDKDEFIKDMILINQHKSDIAMSLYKFEMFSDKFKKLGTAFQKQCDLIAVKSEIAERLDDVDGMVAFNKIRIITSQERDMATQIHNRLSSLTGGV